MATPERGALWLENWTLSATIAAYTNQHVNYAAKRLLSPHRSDTWQSTGVGTDTSVVFDLGTTRLPTCFGLIESNLDGGTFIRLRGSDNAAQTVNAVYWDFPLYTQDRVGKVLAWYLGDPTSGSIGSGRRFWGVRILPTTFGSYNTAEDYYEIGVVWLGEYVAIRPWSGTRVRARDASTRTKAYSGAQWSDPIKPYREAHVRVGGLTEAEAYALEEVIRAQGASHALLDLHGFSSDAALKRGGRLYGYFTDDPVDVEIDTPEANSLRLQFEEASG